jgi:NhaP-type Na+/H+ or K+/H+ antiporter
MILFRTFLFYLIFFTHCVTQAAELANVFTHITSTLNGIVFFYLGVELDSSPDEGVYKVVQSSPSKTSPIYGLVTHWAQCDNSNVIGISTITL